MWRSLCSIAEFVGRRRELSGTGSTRSVDALQAAMPIASVAVAVQKGSLLKRQGTMFLNMGSMLKPAPGPESEFFTQHLHSKSEGVYRNTSAHWHVDWYLRTRGRPLIKFRQTAQQNIVGAAKQLQNYAKAASEISFSKQAQHPDVAAEGSLSKSAPALLSRKAPPPVGVRARIWHVMENHPAVNTFIFMVITLSATTDMLETEFRLLGEDTPAYLACIYIDYVAVAIFTLELVLRVASCPSLKRFACSPMNWIDVLAVFPSYVGYIVASEVAEGDSGFLEVRTAHKCKAPLDIAPCTMHRSLTFVTQLPVPPLSLCLAGGHYSTLVALDSFFPRIQVRTLLQFSAGLFRCCRAVSACACRPSSDHVDRDPSLWLRALLRGVNRNGRRTGGPA